MNDKRTATTGLRGDEANTARRLERMIANRTTITMCYLTYGSDEQRERIAAHAAERLGAERTSLGEARSDTTQELVRLLGGPAGAPPLQATDPGAWPGGARTLGETLAIARDTMRNECQRPVLVTGTDAEINEMLQGGEDLHGWSCGTYDFAADEREARTG